MRFFLTIFLTVVFAFMGLQVYRLQQQEGEFGDAVITLDAQASALAIENQKLRSDLEYYKDDRNLTKELQSKFNYRKPEEKMYMLVPAKPE